jgi:ABC-type multidrug transport system ATPase subunit
VSVREAPRAPGAQAAGVEITAVGLCKTVKGGRQVLHDVSFAVWPGELVAIVGGSGAGKTMLLEVSCR